MSSDDPFSELLDEANFPAIIDDVERLSDRGAGIVAVAIIDDRLTYAIDSIFEQKRQKIAKKYFTGRGALTSFAAKIDFGLLWKLYDEDDHEYLHAAREIRNKFAHEPGPVSFEMRLVEPYARKLEFASSLIVGKDAKSRRNQFLAATSYLTGMLILSARRAKRTVNPQSPHT